MIQIDTRYEEILLFDTATAGVPQPEEVIYRLFMGITDGFELCLKGKHDTGELVFTIPALRDIIKALDNKQIPFHIEALIDDSLQTVMQSELILLNPPEIAVSKMTHIKQQREEIKQPVKVEEKLIVKEPSAFAKSFEIYIGENKK